MAKRKKIPAKDLELQLRTSTAVRKEVFEELKQHLKAGYSLDCFGPLSETSILEYLETYPDEFVRGEFVEAIRLAKQGWENLGRQQAAGTCLGNSRSWYYNMVNRYGWHEKSQVETSGTQAVNVNIVSYQSPKQSTTQTE